MAEMVNNLPTLRETQVQSLDWEDPLEEGMATHSSILGEFHGQRSLAGYSPWGKRGRHNLVTKPPPPICSLYLWGFPGGSVSKESTYRAGDAGSIPGLGRSPGGGHGNPLHYSCRRIPMDRGAWWAAVHRIAQSWT